MSISNIAFLEEDPTYNNPLHVGSGLQVAAGVEGRVLLSNELEADGSVGTSGLTDGTHYVYADLNEDGTYAGFGSTDVEPQVGLSKKSVSRIPVMSQNTDKGWVVESSSELAETYSTYLMYDGIKTTDANGWIATLTGDLWTGVHKEDLSPVAFTRVIVYPWYDPTSELQANFKDVVIEGSIDNLNWDTLANHTFNTWSQNIPQSVLLPSSDHVYYRIRVLTNYGWANAGSQKTEWLINPDFYNTSTHTHYGKYGNILKRVYIGEFDVAGGIVTKLINYQHGTTVTIPVNDGVNIGINSAYYLDKPYLGYCNSQARIYSGSKWARQGGYIVLGMGGMAYHLILLRDHLVCRQVALA